MFGALFADTPLLRIRITRRDVIAYTAVFLLCLVTGQLGLSVYATYHLTPAIIWPPVGIAIAAVVLYGYDVWFAVFLAQFLIRMFADATLESALISATAYAIQPVLIVYCMRWFGFETSHLAKLRNILLFVIASLTLTAVAPLISSINAYATGALNIGFLTNVSRGWGSGVFSALIITPLVLTWYPWSNMVRSRKEIVEICGAFALLVATDIFLFWTQYPQYVGISIVFFLPAVLIWFALRLHPKWLTFGVLLTSMIGIMGTFVLHGSTSTLSDQLLSDEVYIAMVAAIFLVFVAVVDERRIASRTLTENNARLQKALERASTEDKAKTEFLAILAHELRNPLAPVISSLELLRIKAGERNEEEMIELVDIADMHNRVIARLLDDLLDISRISQKKFKLQKQAVELHEVVENATQTVDAVYRSKSHTLLISLPDYPLWFEADPMRLGQVVVNLLFNAAKYTQPGGHITLSATADGTDLCMRISDNGIGIEKHMLQRIFEPFVQVAKSGSQVSTGLGIGLALTKRLVELHGGRIWARSEGTGKGSEFVVSLPIEQTVQLPLDAATKEAPTEKISDTQDRDRDILVVDDNEAAARGLSLLLKHKGHTVAVAHDGASAIQMMQEHRSSVVLLDIGLPDTDGYDVCRSIRDMYGTEVLIVAITGYGQADDKLKAHQAGFDYHLTKPVGIADIERILAGSSPQDTHLTHLHE